jgi:hypothetical protein
MRDINPEPVFANLLVSPGIDSQFGGQVRQPYLTYGPARLHRLAESVLWNRFLGSLNVTNSGSAIRREWIFILLHLRGRCTFLDFI